MVNVSKRIFVIFFLKTILLIYVYFTDLKMQKGESLCDTDFKTDRQTDVQMGMAISIRLLIYIYIYIYILAGPVDLVPPSRGSIHAI